MTSNTLEIPEAVAEMVPDETHSSCQESINHDAISQFHRILADVVEAGGSDVHLKPDVPIKGRIHGHLTALEGLWPSCEWLGKVIGRMVPEQSWERFGQTGQIDFSYDAPGIGRFRTNIYRQRGQHAIAMRFVKNQAPTLEQLGLPLILKDIAAAERGIILVAGTTGSGKSTTMAAMIEHINETQAKNIVTLEDPIEFLLEDNQCDIKQREVGVDVPSFGDGLRGVLRQDPDIILIGEMRDATSFAAALSAADTGHLVFSTLHVTNAAQGVGRVLDFFKAEDREHIRRQLASTLRAIICQRMVRKAKGGITPAVEILINTLTVRKMIEQNRLESLGAAIETGTDEGMQTFNQALFKLVKSGVVAEDEALAKASNPEALEMNLNGIFLSQSSRILGG